MAKRAEDRKTYDTVPMEYFLEKCRAIDGAGLNVSLQSENPGENGAVWFRVLHGMTATSWGEKITITVRPTPSGTGSDVHILSECGMPTQLIDYGKNKSNCQAIFGYLEAGLPSAEPAQAAPAQATPQQEFVFCTECGAKNFSSANFCMHCGSKLMHL